MTIAEIHGKISDAGTNLSERMEDLLTSDVFGCLRYLPPEKALLPFLHTARSLHGRGVPFGGEIVRVHTSFWPWLKSSDRIPCEPDVVLGLEVETGLVHLVMVEAKYYSGLSSEEGEDVAPQNQLARELDNLSATTPARLNWDPGLRVASRTLLFITADLGMPRNELAAALDEFRRKRKQEGDIHWTSWRSLPSILEDSLETERDPGSRAVLEDMLALLLRKGLVTFTGVERVAQRLTLSFSYRSTRPSYRWPDIPKPSGNLQEYVYQVVSRD
jgi:hypothetical protein